MNRKAVLNLKTVLNQKTAMKIAGKTKLTTVLTLYALANGFSAAPVYAEGKTIYKIVKPDGSVIYSDKPVAGATEFKLKGSLNLSAPTATTSKPQIKTTAKTSAKNSKTATAVNYQLTLTSPANDATVRSNEGKATITASFTPDAQGVFQLYLNDVMVQQSPQPQFQLNGLSRGEYQIKINYLDQTGKLLASTPPSTFYLQKVSALLRPN